MNNIINKIKRLINIKLRFDFPESKKILKYDEAGVELLKKTIKKDFNIIPTRNIEIYFWIYIKQIIFLDFSFLTYFKNYVKFTSTKIVINILDNRMFCYNVKNELDGVYFITIQNGHRDLKTHMFQKGNSKFINKNFKTDHFFFHNKYVIKEYDKVIKYNNAHIMGSYNNNFNSKIGKTIFKNSYLFISYGTTFFSYPVGINIEFLRLLNSYFLNSNKKLNILLKSKRTIDQKIEINFYKKFINCNHTFIKLRSKLSPYKTLDKYENIIFTNSTLGYEAIARNKKVVVFPVDLKKINTKYFGWPKKYQKNYDFFLAKKLTYSEVKRVLENVSNCNQVNWNKNHYKNVKELMPFDKNNSQLREVIDKILKNSD
tara:strand:- start:18 stop:1133 length:1116 start_codon:yes stop_codon:yes gene_type:complete